MRKIIDRDIARLEESIRTLKSRRNELSPIYRLPAEVLCIIFSFTEDLSRSRSPKSWTNFSQVSQHWRSSALSAPELWTNIPVLYPRWAQEMLIRSKKAILTIRSDLTFDNFNQLSNPIEAVRSCLCEMNRVEKIDLNFIAIPGSTLEEIFRDLPRSAPQLHTLCITPRHFSGPAFSIHEDFLYDTERLQCVKLINCEISWDSRLLNGLTHLTLQNSSKPNSTIIEFLHALQQMPALTDLHLEESIPDDSNGPSTYPDVDLPCLRLLRISTGVGPLITVLRHIAFPHTAKLNLTCRGNQSIRIDFSNFLSVLATKFLSSLVIRSLSLRALNRNSSLEFYLWTTAFIQDCFPSPSLISKSRLQLVLTWPSPQSHNYVKALICAFDAISLPFLTQLQISTSEHCIDSKTWAKTFGRLPLLERVCVQNYAHSFLEALVYKKKEAETSKTVYRTVFPKLRYINLESTEFFGMGSISVDMLLDCLMERCERNADVWLLRLDNCYNFSSHHVERLREIVVDVIWDGKEHIDSDLRM